MHNLSLLERVLARARLRDNLPIALRSSGGRSCYVLFCFVCPRVDEINSVSYLAQHQVLQV